MEGSGARGGGEVEGRWGEVGRGGGELYADTQLLLMQSLHTTSVWSLLYAIKQDVQHPFPSLSDNGHVDLVMTPM